MEKKCESVTLRVGQTRTPGHTKGGIWCLGGVSILYQPVSLAHCHVQVNEEICHQVSVEKRLNNCYETHQTAFDPMTVHIGKLNHYNGHKICEMLPLNMTVETSATNTCK